ncbi:hypothetical protein ACFPK9_15850 [Rubritalea spongiae]|uniref:Uncharacterized protein n=1 Tax=Rubritalea spongiae TaxID=430797 RepID=A0ABW5E640_9BACT
MITVEKIKIYQRFRGDIDGFARAGAPDPITDDDWRWIDNILSRLHMIHNVSVSKDFKESTYIEIHKTVDSVGSAELLKSIAQHQLL